MLTVASADMLNTDACTSPEENACRTFSMIAAANGLLAFSIVSIKPPGVLAIVDRERSMINDRSTLQCGGGGGTVVVARHATTSARISVAKPTLLMYSAASFTPSIGLTWMRLGASPVRCTRLTILFAPTRSQDTVTSSNPASTSSRAAASNAD